jgi:hypothetical protein
MEWNGRQNRLACVKPGQDSGAKPKVKRMKQKQVRSNSGLLAQSAKAINGATEVGAGLLTINVETAMSTDRATYVTALEALKTGKTILVSRGAVVRSVTASGREFARVTRELLKRTLSKRYSTAWAELGFLRSSLAIPRKSDEMLVMLEQMGDYLTAHPEAQNTDAEVTPARAGGLVTSLREAQRGLDTQKGNVVNLVSACDNAKAQLQKRMRDLVLELRQKLAPLDGRWKTFGLNMPGAAKTPDAPQNVVAVLIGETAVAIHWDAAARAEHYRVWKKVVGVDEKVVSVGSPADLDFTLEALPRNSTIEIAVTAVNNGGESARSLTVSVVTH